MSDLRSEQLLPLDVPPEALVLIIEHCLGRAHLTFQDTEGPGDAVTLEDLKLDAADKIILVAQEEGMVVGSVRFWTVAGVCVIRLLSVSLAHQGRGVGKALMREAEGMAPDAHKFYVCTMLRTPRNIGLFLSLGYRPESLLPNHYHKLDLICFAKYAHVDPPRQ